MTDNLFYALQLTDVNKPTIQCFGRTWLVANFLGRVLPRDVGKRVYRRGAILQVENDEQREARRAELAARLGEPSMVQQWSIAKRDVAFRQAFRQAGGILPRVPGKERA